MSLQYVIDGYNLINHQLFIPANKRTKDSRIALLELIRLKKLCGSPANAVIVVFDGYPDTDSLKEFDNKIDVIFARCETADERIKKIVENFANPKNIRVVSDDKEIKFSVRAMGAGVLSVEEFIGHDRNLRKPQDAEVLKPELTYEAMHKINQELRKIWLNKDSS